MPSPSCTLKYFLKSGLKIEFLLSCCEDGAVLQTRQGSDHIRCPLHSPCGLTLCFTHDCKHDDNGDDKDDDYANMIIISTALPFPPTLQPNSFLYLLLWLDKTVHLYTVFYENNSQIISGQLIVENTALYQQSKPCVKNFITPQNTKNYPEVSNYRYNITASMLFNISTGWHSITFLGSSIA